MKAIDDCLESIGSVQPADDDPRTGRTALAARLRTCLGTAVRRLASGAVDIRQPGGSGSLLPRGEGHFHLAAELFIQLSGWTAFQFQQGELRLEAGEFLLVPARVLHRETVGTGSDGRCFENLVVYAEDGAFRCHLAREVANGVPGILYLDMGRHAQAARVQEWLAGAALAAEKKAAVTERASGDATPAPSSIDWRAIQARALVTAALTGIQGMLDERQNDIAPEPMLVSRVRVMVQNQLGDRTLTVGQLAAQTGYSADYLSNLFSIATGEHLSAFINRLRLERAARLLRESTLAGKEIAWACGFASPSYFIRAFRAHFGQTPRTWRQAHPYSTQDRHPERHSPIDRPRDVAY